MSTRVTAPIVAAFGASANIASDYEENINKMDVAFGEYANHVRDFTDNAYMDYGLSKVDASDIASSFGAMAKGIGFAEDKASDMSIALTGLSADLASYFNTDVETAGTALEGIFTGNAQSLKKFGVVMTDVNLKEFALSIGMTAKEYENLGAQDKTLLRFNYVMSQTADAQGDFARTNDGMANASKTLKASVEDLGTAIGTQLLPMIVPVIQKITEVIHKLSELDPNVMETIVKIGLVVAAVGPVLLIVGKVISLVGTLITIIGALMSPMGLIVGAIALVVGAGVALYKNWDTIKQKASELHTKLSTTFNNIKNSISSAMDNARNVVKNAIDKIKGFFNFSWSLPKLKLPHFRTSGSFSWSLSKGLSLPTISVDWYAKAMKNGMILNNPTIFGAMNGKLLGGGEVGSETIVGTNSLMNMIREASQGTIINMTINAQDQNVYQLADLVIDRIVATTKAERNVFK